MKYLDTLTLKDGRKLTLRSGGPEDGPEAFDLFCRTHAETDHLLSYPDEITLTPEEEADFLRRKAENEREAEIFAILDGKLVGFAGFDCVGPFYKLRHRAEFGISIEKACWRLGIGRALTDACIRLARQAGYKQLELSVFADNAPAIALYESMGFTEYGRNPLGFNSRISGYCELVLMRLEL